MEIYEDTSVLSGATPFEAMMHAPVLRSTMINPAALDRHFQTMTSTVAAAPEHVLLEVRRRQQIDAHNAEIDAAKAQKKQLRQIAKQARMPVEAVKRMVKSVRRA